MIVTKIERQKRSPERFNLYLDGAFAFGIHGSVMAAHGIRTGEDLSETAVARIKTLEEARLARESAVKLLGYRRRSEHEIRLRLREKEFHPATIETVVSQLRDINLLNDLEFAKAYIHDRQLKKPTGSRLLERELRMRGVSSAVIVDALREVLSGPDQEASALKAAQAAMKRHSRGRLSGDPSRQREKIASFLTGRGFPWEIVAKVLQKLFGDKYSTADGE